MAAYLFIDDQRLLVREDLRREIGAPELLPDTLSKEGFVSGAFPRVCKRADGSWLMFYQSFVNNNGTHTVIRAAKSVDGLHFTSYTNAAAEAGIDDPVCPDQIIPGWNAELATFVDTGTDSQRLKMVVSEYEYEKLGVNSKIYVSDDGIRWTETGDKWHRVGTEPLASAFFSSYLNEYVLLCRPMWGTRRVCVSLTKDFRQFTDPQPLMQADALDRPLDETYGLTGFQYKDMYLGILHMYSTLPSDTWKYVGGKIEGQLAYSFDGAHWLRSLREPLMKNESPFAGLIFTSDMRVDDDGSVLLYASGTDLEHGYFAEGDPAIGVFRLREDDFVHLRAKGEGRLRTRETLLGTHFDININCKRATCALFTPDGSPLEGFGHEDCVPFSGDATHWTPGFRGDTTSLAGRVVTVEIRLEDGCIYGINGDFVKLINTEAWRYAKFGMLPDRSNP